MIFKTFQNYLKITMYSILIHIILIQGKKYKIIYCLFGCQYVIFYLIFDFDNKYGTIMYDNLMIIRVL